eukprot:765774-Hanusia_phi.AAC.1
MLQMLTCVQPKRQKIIGLGKKSNLEDDVTLDSLQLKNPHSFMMVMADAIPVTMFTHGSGRMC